LEGLLGGKRASLAAAITLGRRGNGWTGRGQHEWAWLFPLLTLFFPTPFPFHITVESRHPVQYRRGQWLLSQVLSYRNQQQLQGKLRPTIRVGLSGPPGAGKSTLVEKLGLRLVKQGIKVAVLVRTGVWSFDFVIYVCQQMIFMVPASDKSCHCP